MITTPRMTWAEENQRELMAAVAEVRLRLESFGENYISADEAAPAALERLCQAFGLSMFERGIMLLCAGMELDSTFAAACATAQGDPARRYPTFSLALATLREPHWSALTPAAPLRRWRLIELQNSAADSLLSTPLRITERVLHSL